MTHRPIFFDPTGRRRRWSLRSVVVTILLIVIAAIAFATSIVNVPSGSPLPIAQERARPLTMSAQIARAKRNVRRLFTGWLPIAKPGAPGEALSVGFYLPQDADSFASLETHVGDLDWVVPATTTVSGANHQLRVLTDRRFDYLMATTQHRPHILTMVQNLDDGSWDTPNTVALLHDPAARARLIQQLSATLDQQKAIGVAFDFEELPETALPDYLKLLDEANRAFDAKSRLVTATVPADETWPIARFAAVTDRVFLMDYDEHWQGGTAGPIASQTWFIEKLRNAIRAVPPGKLIVALGSYGYDWHGGQVDALTVPEALLAANDSGAVPTFDRTSGNSSFAYVEDGVTHTIWMLDAAASWNQMQAARALGLNSVAVWRMGSEDPGYWKALGTWRSGKGRPDLTTIAPRSDVDIEGTGEILRIAASPQAGKRTIAFEPNGLISDVRYDMLPTPYVVRRTGASDPKKIALTFDDGPDPTWTPRILDVLEREKVPATFFVIGENAIENEGLLKRIVNDGFELGNHSYTHPNMAHESAQGTRLELNATQRLIEAYTGRSTKLFRAPYFGDAEPTTADEIDPALIAQQLGYTIVGLHVDPGDWKTPGVDTIVNSTLDQILNPDPDRSANVVLLHDGGGDRAQTVAALPRIIDALKAQGYSFVPVSELAGQPRDAVMPKVSGRELSETQFDIGIFRVLATIEWGLRWLFFLAIGLGMGRAILMTVLAVQGRNRYPAPPMAESPPHVSVIIPAYNEERVIEASVRRVLASEGVTVNVIVADDGSKDRTSEIVREAFGNEPRVQLLTLVNGGKAAALNRALQHATSEIIIALDADTQFEPLTIARLARWFSDPDIGAVAGNAKVGNRVNLPTRWQAVEYVTAQNVERRALARFDAMTVVPGAVGAWRREALDDVGGYPTDTLAEDQDLTIAIQRANWEVGYDIEAVAWTEAPETFRALAKQRFRWAFGTLQCLWKHRAVLWTRRPAGLALVGLPQAWLFQILFAAVSPVIDLALIVSMINTSIRVYQHGWAQTHTDLFHIGFYWLVFTAIDLACGWTAYKLEPREKHFPGGLLLGQRFIYRQLMYWVVLRAIASAIAGFWVGWGKLERTGRNEAQAG